LRNLVGSFSRIGLPHHGSIAPQMAELSDRISTLVIDDAHLYYQDELIELIRKRSARNLRTILTSNFPLSFGGTPVELPNLDRYEFLDYINKIFEAEFKSTIADELYSATAGNPLVTSLLRDAQKRSKLPLSEIADLLKPFDQPGLVGLDGRPLSSDSPAAKR